MRTMICSYLLAVSLVLNSGVVVADEKSHRQAAEDLLKATNTEKAMETVMDQMLASSIQRNPQLAPYQDVMKKFLSKHVSFESLQEELITIYTAEFKEEELKQIVAFYQTPAGKKVIEKLPQLAVKAAELGVARVQANQAELQQMIEEAMNKKEKAN